MGVKELCTSMAQTLPVGRGVRGFTTTNIGDWTRERGLINWSYGAVDRCFPPGKGGSHGVAYAGKGKGILIHTLTEGSGMPLSNRITPALPMVVKDIK